MPFYIRIYTTENRSIANAQLTYLHERNRGEQSRHKDLVYMYYIFCNILGSCTNSTFPKANFRLKKRSFIEVKDLLIQCTYPLFIKENVHKLFIRPGEYVRACVCERSRARDNTTQCFPSTLINLFLFVFTLTHSYN